MTRRTWSIRLSRVGLGLVVAGLVTSCGGDTERSSSGSGEAGPDAPSTDATAPRDSTAELAACVGSTDCEVLARCSDELSLDTCLHCQGLACGADPVCDASFPCVDGRILIRGCDTDSQCQDITPFCGQYIAVNGVCVDSDDI